MSSARRSERILGNPRHPTGRRFETTLSELRERTRNDATTRQRRLPGTDSRQPAHVRHCLVIEYGDGSPVHLAALQATEAIGDLIEADALSFHRVVARGDQHAITGSRSGRMSLIGQQKLAHLASQHLSDHRSWQLRDELNPLGDLVRREPGAAERTH